MGLLCPQKQPATPIVDSMPRGSLTLPSPIPRNSHPSPRFSKSGNQKRQRKEQHRVSSPSPKAHKTKC